MPPDITKLYISLVQKAFLIQVKWDLVGENRKPTEIFGMPQFLLQLLLFAQEQTQDLHNKLKVLEKGQFHTVYLDFLWLWRLKSKHFIIGYLRDLMVRFQYFIVKFTTFLCQETT